MRKIPVFATVSRAYGFLLGEIGTILRLAWAPFLAVAAFSFTYGGKIMEAAMRAKDNPSVALEMLPLQLLLGAVTFIAAIMVTVALLRVVIFGDRKPGLFVYLWFGASELRLVGAYLLLLVAIIASALVAGVVFVLLGVIAAAVPAAAALVGVAVVVLMVVAIWAILRLTLVAPAVVAENNLGVERSWKLMSGNALRMFTTLFLTNLPIAIVSTLVFMVVLGADFPWPDFKSLAAGKPDKDAVQQAIEAWQTNLYGAMVKHWPELSVLTFVSNIVNTALSAGVAGNAYNALTDRGAEQTFS